ncbi:MAG: DUF547 domain-containing protein [Planctomycetes bacterium]|nr:DUF547 domain-containing protein [Planctomycetota bacterium]
MLLALAGEVPGEDFDHQHRAWGQVLRAHVQDGLADYAGLKAARDGLDAYLDLLASVSEARFARWRSEEQQAFLINLYNAATVHLIIDHYPVGSIKEIGSLLKGPWSQPVVRLFSEKVTLDHVEHERLRKTYDEPRIHFALVCAAKGCPPLRSEPYVPDRLDEQLEDQGRKFLGTPGRNFVDGKNRTLHLSPIFKWYATDFEKKAGSVMAYVRPFFSKEVSEKLGRGDFDIAYTNYDWSLNDSKSADSPR